MIFKRTAIRSVCIILIAVFAILFVDTADTASASSIRIAKIEQVEGDVTVRKAGGSKTFSAYSNMQLHEGDHLLTGANSRAVLKITDQADELNVGNNSNVYFSQLRETDGKKRTIIKILSGSVLVHANPSKKAGNELTIETPISTMDVKGTHFMVGIDPLTGTNFLNVFAGIVTVQNGRNDGQDGAQDVYPTQQATLFGDPEGEEDVISIIDLNQFIDRAGPKVIEALLKNKQSIDEENADLREVIRKAMEDNKPVAGMEDFLSNADESEKIQKNIENLLRAIATGAVKNGSISKDELQSIIDQLGERLQDRDLNTELELSEREKQNIERLRQIEEERMRQANREMEEQKRQQQAILEKLEQQRREQEERNRKAAEVRKKQAEEEYLKKLAEEQRKQLEDRMKEREMERNQQRPEPPLATILPPRQDEPPQNNVPEAKGTLDFTMMQDEHLILLPENVATDADGDSLTFTNLSGANDDILLAYLDDNGLNLKAVGLGTVEIVVHVSDGTDTVSVTFSVTVPSPDNHIIGTITLPEPAPASGIPLTVFAYAWHDGIETELKKEVIIPEGESSIYYHIEIPEAMLDYAFEVSYELDDSFANEQQYVRRGFFGEAEESEDFVYTKVIVGENSNDVHLSIVRGHMISGQVRIPQVAANGGVLVDIVARGPAGFVYEEVMITEGNNSATYQMIVPPGDDYYIRYDYQDYVREKFSYPQYYYLNIDKFDFEEEGMDPEWLPDLWLEQKEVAVKSEYNASALDLSASGGQTLVNLNFPMYIPEHQVIVKNDMILVTIDAYNEEMYISYSNSYLDYSELDSWGADDVLITELNPNQSYLFRYIGYSEVPNIYEGASVTDLNFIIKTDDKPFVNGLEGILTGEGAELNWEAVTGATEYRIFVYERGTLDTNSFKEPVQTVNAEGLSSVSTIINGLNMWTEYVIRVEAWNETGLLAGTTLQDIATIIPD